MRGGRAGSGSGRHWVNRVALVLGLSAIDPGVSHEVELGHERDRWSALKR